MKSRFEQLEDEEKTLRARSVKLKAEQDKIGRVYVGTKESRQIAQIDADLSGIDSELRVLEQRRTEFFRLAQAEAAAMNEIILANLWRIDFSDSPGLQRLIAAHLARRRELVGDE